MRLLEIILFCLLLGACAELDLPSPELSMIPAEDALVPENFFENATENLTENTTVILEDEPVPNESAEPLFTGAVDVTARIGAFKTRQTFQEGEGLQVGNRTLVVIFIGEGSGAAPVLPLSRK